MSDTLDKVYGDGEKLIQEGIKILSDLKNGNEKDLSSLDEVTFNLYFSKYSRSASVSELFDNDVYKNGELEWLYQ